jgi:hypothetical protein
VRHAAAELTLERVVRAECRLKLLEEFGAHDCL